MADAFFNPSMCETFGKVTVEALSCGTPVVVYKATASPELVKDGCGYVVDIHDTFAASRRLNEIKSNGKQSYSDACRNFAVENFSENKLQGDYLSLYKELTL